MNSMFTVIKFTFLSRFRSKSFRVMSLILIVLITVMMNLPALIQKLSTDEVTKIGVLVESQPEIADKLAAFYSVQEKPEIEIVPIPSAGSKEADEKLAKQKITDKEIEGYLEFDEAAEGSFPKATYKSEGSMEFSVSNKLQTALQLIKTDLFLKGAGITPEQLASIQSPVTMDTVQISTQESGNNGKTESQMMMAFALVYVLLFLLYMGVIGFGNMVAMEITAEKSSRVMEILITSVSPLKQMFGKIIGICLLALVQIVMIIAVAAANLSLSSNNEIIKEFNLSWSDLEISMLVYFLIFYIMGFFIYATIFAAVGSLVSRTEDVGQAIMPVTFLIIGAFFIAMFGLNDPNAGFVVAMSFVPFFTPLIMFLRIGLGNPAIWEIWLSIGILFASIVAIGWLAAKIYRTGVLMYGKRPSWKELRKAMRAYKVN
ncbi:ABC transporter permease [Paenibacillus eucommiae]|uniref:ABC-2 type transport system permease protein n=1 Tax=Paenibacillus eucommiae TaxID=1355755 RepID=A0ABS4IXX8_9BACL|nr:ABC transporter permease [Paenibacillus eucommiae]MBP1992434.1 ABC-2 type transport system permease protein [Paenibacillus eucommiae]